MRYLNMGDTHLTQSDVALQYARVAAPLVLCGLAEVHGARNVCCTAVVLATRVNQQQRVGVNSPAKGTQWQGIGGSGSSNSRQENCCQKAKLQRARVESELMMPWKATN
jgi:hypothetical protein